MTTLTAGQVRIREIINKYLKIYQKIKTTTISQDKDKALKRLFIHIRKKFEADPIITKDIITGQQLGYSKIAKSYLRWLDKYDTRTRITENFPPVQLDHFVYDYGDLQEKRQLPAYTGGIKWASTISCLFGLAEGKKLERGGLDAIYYNKAGILTISSGGNHRLLAHVLWGEPSIQPHHLIMIEETNSPNPQLNRALLIIETIFVGTQPFRFTNYSVEETNWIIRLAVGLATDELKILKSYAQYLYDDGGGWQLERLTTIEGLQSCLNELRILSNRPKLQNWFLRTFRNQRRRSNLEYWFEETFLTPTTKTEASFEEYEEDYIDSYYGDADASIDETDNE
jgi:hypothetical protein